MRTLAYVMIHNLYPVTNLTTLSVPRTMFLYGLFTHKEINICGHILHLLNKSIEKQNSRTVMPFPLTHYGSNCEDKAQTPEWSQCGLEGLSHWCTHSHWEHNPHQRLQNRCAYDTTGSCWGRGWRYRGGDWEIHFCHRAISSAIILSTSTRTRQPWSSSWQSKADVHYARFPYAAHSGSVCLCPGSDHSLIISDRWFIYRLGFKLRVRPVLALWPFQSKRGSKFWGGACTVLGGAYV